VIFLPRLNCSLLPATESYQLLLSPSSVCKLASIMAAAAWNPAHGMSWMVTEATHQAGLNPPRSLAKVHFRTPTSKGLAPRPCPAAALWAPDVPRATRGQAKRGRVTDGTEGSGRDPAPWSQCSLPAGNGYDTTDISPVSSTFPFSQPAAPSWQWSSRAVPSRGTVSRQSQQGKKKSLAQSTATAFTPTANTLRQWQYLTACAWTLPRGAPLTHRGLRTPAQRSPAPCSSCHGLMPPLDGASSALPSARTLPRERGSRNQFKSHIWIILGGEWEGK